jgi:hypothetical protein
VRKSCLAIAILAAAVLACIEPAATPQNRRSQPAQQVAPFEITMEALPPNYQGVNIETLFKQLSLPSAKLAKGEFETTEQHRQRLQRFIFPIGGSSYAT